MFVLTSQLNLHKQIDSPPDRVQQAGEREVEESQPEILRLVAAMNRLIDLYPLSISQRYPYSVR
jgi:hypothetical protein